jgi:hypothetical protein
MMAARVRNPHRSDSSQPTMKRKIFAPGCLTVLLIVSGRMLPGSVASEQSPVATTSSPGPRNSLAQPSRSARCTVRQEANGWWLISPTGKRFFSLGVCEFNQGADQKAYDPAKPSYAGWRQYDSPKTWAANSVKRLKSWGFTTAGGWSDFTTLEETGVCDLWMTPVVNLGARSGAPWFDMWDERVLRRIDELAKESVAPWRGNQKVIGYYSDNEIGWWNAILWKMALEQPRTSGQRQRLIRVVRDLYADDWTALIKDFEPQNAGSWEELNVRGMLWLRPGGNGIRAMRRFLGIVAERYYEVMHRAICKYDPDAMYLGDRYQSFYYPELAAGARAHVDVVSTNLNASWNDGTFLNSYLESLHELTGKPLMISEFYMAAAENRSGNQNKVGGFPTVATQRERSDALVSTLRALLRRPYVVGADWFQYYDEPPHGRKRDGEDYNFGLVDIHDQPYDKVTSAFGSIDLPELKSAGAPPPNEATAGVPPAPLHPLAEFQPMTAIKSWDRQRGYVSAASDHPTGDLYICWNPKAIYLATMVIDIVEPDYYKDGEIPDVDRAAWSVQLDQRVPVTARIGAGKAPVIDNPLVRIESLSGTYHDVRCITAIELPANLVGKERFAVGDRITLDSTFVTLGRAERIEWKGEFLLVK